MTPEEVIGFFAPHQSRVDTVISWLVDSGISRDRIGHSTNKQVGRQPLIANLSPRRVLYMLERLPLTPPAVVDPV